MTRALETISAKNIIKGDIFTVIDDLNVQMNPFSKYKNIKNFTLSVYKWAGNKNNFMGPVTKN